MTKEQQDFAWKCLANEARESISFSYKNSPCGSWVENLFEEIYGEHNLTSDTEPEEMLHISRQAVLDKYAEIFWNKAPYLDNSPEALQCQACLNVLKSLFGDKCLPDKEEQNIPKHSNSFQIGKFFLGKNEQPKPKFKVGDKVVICSKPYDIKWDGIVKTIKSVELNEDGEFVYSFYDYNYNIVEDTFPHLRPYNEEPKIKSKEAKETQKEEKELTLCELLKGCEGEEIFLPDAGKYKIIEVSNGEIVLDNGVIETHLQDESLYFAPTGFAYAYPSMDLFFNYPLAA